MYQCWANYWHPFRLFAFFSLFALLTIRTGDPAYLLFLLFLLFLVPVPAQRSEKRTLGFLPIVNEGGRRVVRWHRLVFVWLFVISATTLGCCLASFVLMGDWGAGIALGVAFGVMYSATVTFDGFVRSVDELPIVAPSSPELSQVTPHD